MKKEIKTISIWDEWTKNWENAKRFFESKGNIKTRSRLKDKWCRDFEVSIMKFSNFSKIKELNNLLK